MQEVNDPNQKVSALPLPWGYRCYGIKAYVEGSEYGGQVVSEMATYCPGEPVQTEKIVLPPTDWLTTGGKWIQDGDCDTYGNGDSYLLANQNSGFGNSAEVLVGSYIVDNNDKDCFRQGDYSGGVKFGQPVLPPGAVVQKAVSEICRDIHGLWRQRRGDQLQTLLCRRSWQSQAGLDWIEWYQPFCG